FIRIDDNPRLSPANKILALGIRNAADFVRVDRGPAIHHENVALWVVLHRSESIIAPPENRVFRLILPVYAVVAPCDVISETKGGSRRKVLRPCRFPIKHHISPFARQPGRRSEDSRVLESNLLPLGLDHVVALIAIDFNYSE